MSNGSNRLSDVGGVRGLLEAAGKSFLRAFGGSLLVLLPGVLAAPNLDQSFGLGVAALIASVTAGIRVLQEFVPGLTFGSVLGSYGGIADSFARAFLGAVLVLLPGVLNAPDLDTVKSLVVALLVGAVTAGLRAVQGAVTAGDVPAQNTGV